MMRFSTRADCGSAEMRTDGEIMPITMQALVDDIEPTKTVLLFGSGSSIPSGAPTVQELIELFSNEHNIRGDYTLSELTSIIETKERTRSKLIATLRKRFENLKPTGGILNLPRYEWKSLYTTNYDRLIEDSYKGSPTRLVPISSNFDFTGDDVPGSLKLFKLHGSIEKDLVDGHQARLILTDADYEHTNAFRDQLYHRLRADLAGAHLVIIGQSLADVHIRNLVNRVSQINHQEGGTGRITLLLYTEDPDRAIIWEERNIKVCFGGIDQFFAALARHAPDHALAYESTGNPLDRSPGLRPITIDVAHASSATPADPSAMFNGWPATYADVAGGLTFARVIADDIARDLIEETYQIAMILGASGLGKTTAARQVLIKLSAKGFAAFEHQGDHTLQVQWWLDVANFLKTERTKGVLFVDDAHAHLTEINALVEELSSVNNTSLQIVITSSKNHWGPRVKSPILYKVGREWPIARLSGAEIDRLLTLVDATPAFKPLLDEAFSGFSRTERRRRLVNRCESETFVCLKNIFASERFDEIILREYAGLSEPLQEIYKLVAAMENAGIRVHRQFVVRFLGIAAQNITTVLHQLEDIIAEYTIDGREAIYGWRGRHPVIVEIVARYKFNDVEKLIDLFSRAIDNISPTYEVEVRSMRDLCNLETGIPRIPDKSVQNTLLRKMMSVAPSERVPRHRLIRNLIDMGEYEKAETEIRIFQSDFRTDGPVARYKLALMIARAMKTPGIMAEDRVTILEQARSYASSSLERYRSHKHFLSTYCELGIAYYKLTGSLVVFDAGIAELKAAEVRLGDPEVTKIVRRFERRMTAEPAPDQDQDFWGGLEAV